MDLLVAVDHNQLWTMASETEDPIDWSHPPPSLAVCPELHILHGVKTAYKSQDLLQQPGRTRVHGIYTCDQGIYRLTPLDYDQQWLVLNQFPNNNHQVLETRLLHK